MRAAGGSGPAFRYARKCANKSGARPLGKEIYRPLKARTERAAAMIRTHEAGALRAAQAGEHVRLAGWVARRRDHGGVTFIDLRDGSGVVQVVLRQEHVAHELRAEYCVLVDGEVRRRPAGNENPELPTGEIEVAGERVEVLSE